LAKPRYRGSQPRYDLIIEKDVEIPMRDGARLSSYFRKYEHV